MASERDECELGAILWNHLEVANWGEDGCEITGVDKATQAILAAGFRRVGEGDVIVRRSACEFWMLESEGEMERLVDAEGDMKIVLQSWTDMRDMCRHALSAEGGSE